MMRILGSIRQRKRARTFDSKHRKRDPHRPFGSAPGKRASATLLSLKLFHGFEKNVASDAERLWANFVERILRSVPLTVVQKVPDDIHAGTATLYEEIMIISPVCTPPS